MNYYDILLAKKLEDDRDTQVVGLSVTENGTYAEEGKVYKPVVVNVEGYKIADISGLPSPIATFTDGSPLPMPKLKVAVEPIQEGSGDPSPTNVRPISGWDEANIVVSPTTDAEDGHTYTIQFKDGSNPLTVYGGTLDVVSGVLTVEWLKFDISQFNITKSVSGLFQTNFLAEDIKKPSSTLSASGYIKSSLFSEIGSTYINGPQSTSPSPDGVMALSSSGMLYFNYLATSDIDVFKKAMENVDFVYELATPQTYQLNPTAVSSLLGVNNIWADTGDVLDGQYFKSL